MPYRRCVCSCLSKKESLCAEASPDRGFLYGTKGSADEELGPVQNAAFFIASYADLCKGRGENVLSVTFGIHPALYDLLRCLITVSDILSGRAVADTQVRCCSKTRPSVGTGVREGLNDLLCPDMRRICCSGVRIQCFQTCFLSALTRVMTSFSHGNQFSKI